MKYLVLFFGLIASCTGLYSQTAAATGQQITIKVLDARSGKPLKGKTVDVWFGTKASGVPTQITTGDDGNATVVIPNSVESIVVAGEWAEDCRGGNEAGKSYIDKNVYRIQDVLHTGLVAQNTCGKAQHEQLRGVLVVFIKPLHWWQRLSE